MIIFTTQPVADTTLVCLYGDLELEDSVPMLAEHLDSLAASADLVIDLTELGTIGSPPVDELTGHLAHAPIHRRTVVIQTATTGNLSRFGAGLEYAIHNSVSHHPTQTEEP